MWMRQRRREPGGGRNDTAEAMLDWLQLDTRDRLTAPAVWPAVQALAESGSITKP
jgi:hypothetical protein